jgi:hypothetical protein
MSDSPSTWEYARLAVGHRLELTLKKWDEVVDAAQVQHLPYIYRWETHQEHAWADSPIELLDKLAYDTDDDWAPDLSPHLPLTVLNALGADGWELVHVQRMEEPEAESSTRPIARAGWYYLFRRETQRASALGKKKR